MSSLGLRLRRPVTGVPELAAHPHIAVGTLLPPRRVFPSPSSGSHKADGCAARRKGMNGGQDKCISFTGRCLQFPALLRRTTLWRSPDVSCMGPIRDPVGRPTGSFNSRRIWLVCPEKSKSGFLSSTVEVVRQMNPRSRVYVHTPPRFELS